MTERERSEHEHHWIAMEITHRIRWNGVRWIGEFLQGGKWELDVELSRYHAAEIARLKGLVPPGGENDSRGENG